MNSREAQIKKAWADLDLRLDEVVHRSGELVESGRGLRRGSWAPFSIQRRSANRKLSPQRVETAKDGRKRFVPIGPFVTSTYASISGTCPRSCTFKDNGCYAQAGQSHLTMARLDRAARGLKPWVVTQMEARGLDSLWGTGVPQKGATGGHDLRLHVGGDASCTRGARALGGSVERLQNRGLAQAWTFTHRWRQIPRSAWGPIRVLASVEKPDEITEAARRGYAPAMTVPRFDSPAPLRIRGVRMIPCPYEASPKKPTCVECRLCLGDRVSKGEGIMFAVHGAEQERARHRLKVINQ